MVKPMSHSLLKYVFLQPKYKISSQIDLNSLIAECTAYDFKVMLEEKKPKSWLKSVSAFANGLGGSLFFGIDNDGIIFASIDTPNAGDHDGDMSETKLIERQQKILNLIKESPTITGQQMSDTLSVSQRTIERDLSTMQKKGVIGKTLAILSSLMLPASSRFSRATSA